jgi:Methyltransferase domain
MQMISRIGNAQLEAGIQGHFAEIGVHHGKLFILLALLARSQERGVAIDLFEQQHLNPEGSGRGNLDAFMKNCARYADPSVVVLHEGDSTKLASRDVIDLAKGPIRLFSVDGGHTGAIAYHDLETAEGALADRGLIIVDDCFNEAWPDVSTGFHRFFAKPRRVVPFAVGRNKTLLTTPNAADGYKRALLNCGTSIEEREFLGCPVYYVSFEPRPFRERLANSRAWTAIRNKPGMPSLRRAYNRLRNLVSG